MKRLTKGSMYPNNSPSVSYNSLGDCMEKLCKLEDLMEKYGIEDIEDLDHALSFVGKQIPKFCFNQEVWFIETEACCDPYVNSGIVDSIELVDLELDTENYKFQYLIDTAITWLYEKELFASEQEAQQKLKELKNATQS